MDGRGGITWTMRNPVTLLGAILAIASFVIIIFLLIFEFIGGNVAPYLGVLAFVVMPAFFVLGLILIPIGIYWARAHPPRAGTAQPLFPVLDLNSPTQRKGFIIWATATLVFVAVLAGVSYRAFAFMESVEFCGALCHTVVHQPEYATYQHSPHARVPCVACHIGEGADWFVRSKISGTRQVLAVATNSYPRPIPVPIRDLRPARETCETCHWPERFYGDILRNWTTYLLDDKNTAQRKTITLKVGGTSGTLGYPAVGQAVGFPTGIHWHIATDNRITYAADPSRQSIPWVRLERPSEPAIEYTSNDPSVTPQLIAGYEHRTMDCMDCHNRPTHHVQTPGEAMDAAITSQRIDGTLPFIKAQGVEVLSQAYPDQATALQTIQSQIADFYQTSQPQVLNAKQSQISAAIAEIQQMYQANAFPHMRVNYQTYSENIGHVQAPGCFRCHDNRHTSPDGQTIRQECTLCHTNVAVRQ